jgi:type IV pilus assembly protein PilQ
MARKNIGKILSGGAILFYIVLFHAPGINVLAAFDAQPVTYTITGSVGVGGVTMSGFPNGPVISDENGFYRAIVSYGWSGTVTPQMRGYNFNPPSKTYSKVSSNLDNEDYVASLMTFTISGTTGLDGVEMNGLPGNPITKNGGLYSAEVDYGWSGTVTPTKEGYTFTPSSKQYNLVTKDQTNQIYNATELTLLISGSVGEAGVTMKGLPGDPSTGRDGTYSVAVKYGFSGTITPVKEGYEFNPPSIQYSDLITSQTNQDFYTTQLTYTISGTAGMSGVSMKGLPNDPVTDDNGYYNITVPHGWSGTVQPDRPGYTFKPASMTYSKVTTEKINENYEPTLIQLRISGSAVLEGVEMNGLPNNPITGSGGLYSDTVDYGWNGTVTPMKEGYTFSPENKTYNLITRDQMNQNFTSAKMKFLISGSVGAEGVELTGLPVKAVSDRDGFYNAEVEYGFTGEITPRKPGYEFEPPSRSYTNVIGPEINQNYESTILKRTLSGMIISAKGQPVENVTVTADNGGGTGITTSDGTYELEVDYGWHGTVAPTLEGYTFTPPNKMYGAVTRDQTQQRYTAIMKTFTISGSVVFGDTPIQGVLMSANNDGGEDITDSKGNYSVRVPYNWTGEITPTKEGLTFDPPSEPYFNVTTDYKDGEAILPKMPAPKPSIRVPSTQAPSTQAPSTAAPPTRTSTLPRPTGQLPTPTQTETPSLPTPTDEQITEAPPAEAELGGVEQDLKSIQKQLEEIMRKQSEGEDAAKLPRGDTQFLEPSVPLISNNFVDEELPSVLQIIAVTAGVPIIPDEEVQNDPSLVNCNLAETPLDRALDIVLAGTPYVVKKTPYYYLVCSGDIESPMFSAVSSTRRIKLSYVKADMAASLLSTHFQKYVQAEPEGNTICVTAPTPLVERIVEDLKQIDQVPTHVLLDARIVIIERGDLLNLGVEWGWPKIQAGVFSNNAKGGAGVLPDFGGKWPWGVQIGYAPDATFTNSLELALNLLAQNQELRTLAKPQVLAQDGKEAQMKVMTEEYYMLTAQTQTTYYQYSELQEIESGTSLQITPHIGDNNDITLEISVEVSDSIARGAESDLPVVTRRTAKNTVRIKDGGTVALAGLTENKTRTDERRVPGLSKLPLIGKLFESTDRENSSREIAVFVTARIVPDTTENVAFEEPAAPAAPGTAPAPAMEPSEEDFRMNLRESLMRSRSFR